MEVNSTFYRLPNRDAVRRWLEQTPDGFVFTVKASRYLTHVKRLDDVRTGAERFYDRIEPLTRAGRLGPILWQLAEQFRLDEERLKSWLAQLPEGMHTVEFRHPSWFTPTVLDLLSRRGVALAIGDHPRRRFQLHEATAPWMFIRLHSGSRGRDGNYSAAELDEWAQRIAAWRRAHEVYAYFNNDWRGFAPANAQGLRQRLDSLAG